MNKIMTVKKAMETLTKFDKNSIISFEGVTIQDFDTMVNELTMLNTRFNEEMVKIFNENTILNDCNEIDFDTYKKITDKIANLSRHTTVEMFQMLNKFFFSSNPNEVDFNKYVNLLYSKMLQDK